MEGPEEEEEKVKERISASAPSTVSCQISHPAVDNNLYEVETCGTANFVDYFLIMRINSASLCATRFVLFISDSHLSHQNHYNMLKYSKN